MFFCRTYAEGVQKRLMAAGIVTELIIVMDSELMLAIEDATRQRVLFAVVITEQNEIHRSITVNILHGMAQGMLTFFWWCIFVCNRLLSVWFGTSWASRYEEKTTISLHIFVSSHLVCYTSLMSL